MTLNPEERQAIISYRLERAYSTMREAEFSFDSGFYNLAANRLYYAVFYACEALLCKEQINVNTHAGVSRMMSLHFVKNGILTLNESRLLKELFRMRQTGDYDDLFDWTKEDIQPLLPKSRLLVDRISNLIQN